MTGKHPHLRRFVQQGDLAGWCAALQPMCVGLVGETSAPHWDFDDLLQEAQVALVRAFRSYDLNGRANPLTYARLIVQRWLWCCAGRDLQIGRQATTVEASSLDIPVGDWVGAPSIVDAIAARGPSVEDRVVVRAEIEQLVRDIGRLPTPQRAAAIAKCFGPDEHHPIHPRALAAARNSLAEMNDDTRRAAA